MKLRAGGIAFLLGILLLIGVTLIVGGQMARFAFTPASSSNAPEVYILVTPGETPSRIAEVLHEKGVVRDADNFLLLGRVIRQWGKIKVGEYRVTAAMTPIEVFSIITSGVSAAYRVTVREGKNMFQIGEVLEGLKLTTRKEFVALCRDRGFMRSLGITDPKAPSLEGYLFPETYFFNRSMSLRDMVKEMVGKFLAKWTPDMDARAQKLGYSRHQIVTLASIIEKETGAPDERPLISSVFHNRLDKNMRLQSDPTTIYGIWETFDGNLLRKHLLQRTDYNTYKIPGLPIGPIANPSLESITAALSPAKSSYLFFVSKNDGTHVFTSSLADHERAVKQFQLNPAAREGKSWRDLRKRQATIHSTSSTN